MDLQKLVIQYQSNKDNKVLESIIQQLKPFIDKKAIKIARICQSEFKDIRQELIIVLLKRLDKYDSSKCKFLTYLFNSMKGDPTDTLQTMVCKKRGGDGKKMFASSISINQVANEGSEDKEMTLEDKIADPHNIRDEIEQRDIAELIEKVGVVEATRILKEER
jgi:hypothetical protein